MTTWNNIPGVFSVEVQNVLGVVCDYDGNALPMLTGLVLPGQEFELVIEFTSSGHHQRASMYGGPDHLGWPEECEEDRTLTRAYLSDYDNKREVQLPTALQQVLFEHFSKQIQEADLPPAPSKESDHA